MHTNQPRANKTEAGNGSKAICRVSNVLRSPSPDPRRSVRMTKILHLLLVFLAFSLQAIAEPVAFPTKAGEYSYKGWKYVYEIQHQGTRSERRIGRLFLNGKEVKGEIGELNQEPIGFFLYFGEHGYNQGWLNTLTYDHEVFGKDGVPTQQASDLLRAARKKMKTEQAGTEQPATRPQSKSEGGDKSQPEAEGRSR